MTALLLFLLAYKTVALDCRPPGPVVPKPTGISNQPAFTEAAIKLVGAIEAGLNGSLEAGWPVENTSFSIGLVSFDQPDKSVPAWEYHHLAPSNINGTKTLTRDSQYLIGSISKVITDYTLLKSGLDLDQGITSYLPSLSNGSSLIQWEHITLRQLASQLADIPPNYGFSEYYYLKDYFEQLGFPKVDNSSYPPCGVIGLNSACTKEQILQGMIESYPVGEPEERPVYSNIAFTLLAYAMQEQTGKNYSELLSDLATDPLGMSSTMVSPGEDDRAVIPPVDNSWGSDYGDNAPGGGLVSTLSDLSIFLHGILDRTILESETAVLEWLKPSSVTGSVSPLVGMPWEIYRTQDLTPNHPHVIDLYAKAGSAYGYQSQAAVIDEYGVAVVLLTAGSPTAVYILYDAVLSTLVPAIDQIAREQAMCYTGSFSSTAEGAGVDFRVNVTQDNDSIVLVGLERNGTDILASLHEIMSNTIDQFLDLVPTTARLYPTGVKREATIKIANGTETNVIKEDWRIDWELTLGATTTGLPGHGLSSMNCLDWTLQDWIYYGSEPLDRVLFIREQDTAEVLGIEFPFLRSGMLMH